MKKSYSQIAKEFAKRNSQERESRGDSKENHSANTSRALKKDKPQKQPVSDKKIINIKTAPGRTLENSEEKQPSKV